VDDDDDDDEPDGDALPDGVDVDEFTLDPALGVGADELDDELEGGTFTVVLFVGDAGVWLVGAFCAGTLTTVGAGVLVWVPLKINNAMPATTRMATITPTMVPVATPVSLGVDGVVLITKSLHLHNLR
jgi:hypothetical protein